METLPFTIANVVGIWASEARDFQCNHWSEIHIKTEIQTKTAVHLYQGPVAVVGRTIVSLLTLKASPLSENKKPANWLGQAKRRATQPKNIC